MKIGHFVALLDTSVLAPMPIADTLLRLADEPPFYIPKWSDGIVIELRRTLISKLNLSEYQAQRRIQTMTEVFPEALVVGYEDLIPAMKNNEKDRHVLAAAVRCNAHAIISNDKTGFPSDVLRPFDISQASDIGWSLSKLIAHHVPCLAKLIHQKASNG